MTKRPRKPPRLFSRRARNFLTALVATGILALAYSQHTSSPQAFPDQSSNDSHNDDPQTAAPQDRQRYNRQEFTVVKVVDGDTFDLAVPDLLNRKPTTRIRLWGVDTPETKHPNLPVMHFGPEAAAFIRRHLLNKNVSIYLEPFQPTRGKYKRLLAYVYLSPDNSNATELPTGWMLNEQLLTQGLAYADTRFDHILKDRFVRLQKQAQRQKRGLWKNATPDQHPQWYRNRHQKK